jgi:hypothetical protein
MVLPLSAKEKLQIQFRKSLRRGHTKNAELDPVISRGSSRDHGARGNGLQCPDRADP